MKFWYVKYLFSKYCTIPVQELNQGRLFENLRFSQHPHLEHSLDFLETNFNCYPQIKVLTFFTTPGQNQTGIIVNVINDENFS